MSPALKKVIGYSILVAVILLIIYPKLKEDKKEGKGAATNGAKTPPPPLPINVLIIEKSSLDFNIRCVGTIQANEEVMLRSEATGKIVKINFKEGSKVSKGQLLIKINDADLQAEYKKAKLKLKLFGDTEKRQKTLLDKGGISLAEMEIAANESSISDADIELLQARINKTEVRAPFSGIIGLENLSEGAFITPTETLAMLQDIGKVKLEFSIPEKYAGQVHIGNIIKFRVPGVEKEFEGSIYAISPRIEEATRTIQIKAVAANNSMQLLPGAFADISLSFDKNTSAIMVPTEAVIPDIKGHKVYLYKNGLAEVTPIKLGIRKEKYVQVVDGIGVGDTLITTGILQLKPSAPVKIKKI